MKVPLVALFVLFASALATPNVSDGRILGGGAAERGQFPYHASLQYCLQGTCQHACGSAIISDLWVLSAAHCITDAPTLGSYQVIAGILDFTDENAERQVISVSYAVIHPDYAGGVNAHDIAVFRLESSLTFSEQVLPIIFPKEDYEYDGDTVMVSGWGSISGTDQNMPSTLQYVEAPLIAPETCKTALDSVLGGADHPFDSESNVCTGPLTGGVSICTGDSGGPIADLQGQYLIGIASWTVTPCGTTGAPSVHIKVSQYYSWIFSCIAL